MSDKGIFRQSSVAQIGAVLAHAARLGFSKRYQKLPYDLTLAHETEWRRRYRPRGKIGVYSDG